MEETAACAENAQHAIQLPEIVESDSLPRGSQKQNDSPGQNRELSYSKVDLYNAAINGDWKAAERLLMKDSQLAATEITEEDDLVLHVATGARQVDFVKRLIELMSPYHLLLRDRNFNTAFCIAAASGCIEIATIMLEKNRNLLEIRGFQDLTPLNMAVLVGKNDMAAFLYGAGDTNYLTSNDRRRLFFDSITNNLYEFALRFLETEPTVALARHDSTGDTALHVLARKPTSVFS